MGQAAGESRRLYLVGIFAHAILDVVVDGEEGVFVEDVGHGDVLDGQR
jgi:hypothetical protein